MKTKKLILFIALFVLLPYARIVFSYEAAVHPLITSKAIDKSKLSDETDYLKEQLGFGLDEPFNGSTVRKWIEQGSYWEDNMNIGIYIRAPRHCYDPTRSLGRFTDLTWIEAQRCGPSGQYTSALEWAWDRSLPDAEPYSWTDALDYYYSALTGTTKASRDDNFANTFRALGQVLHLIEDMAVPAHVRNDNHAPHYGKDYYECYLTPKWFSVFLPVIQTAEAQNLSTFNNYWELADYTNYNYVSDDTILTEHFSPERVHYFAHPTLESTDFTSHDDVVVIIIRAEDGIDDAVRYLNKVSDGEIIDRFLGVGYFSPYLDYDPNIWALQLGLDDEVSYHYAEKLLPKAVGYSAGLIDYFFRGKLGIPTAEATSTATDVYDLTLEIENESSVTMTGGTLTLMVKTDDTSYANLGTESGVSIASGVGASPFEWNLSNKYIPMPAYADDDFRNIEFTLVYDGQIGQEEGVAGKVFTCEYCIDNIPPEITDVTIKNELGAEILPDENDVYMVWNTVTIEVDVTDTGSVCFSGIDKVVFFVEDDIGDTYYLNGTADIPTQDDHDEPIEGTYTIGWNTDIFDEGEYTLHILAYDQVGNVRNISIEAWKKYGSSPPLSSWKSSFGIQRTEDKYGGAAWDIGPPNPPSSINEGIERATEDFNSRDWKDIFADVSQEVPGALVAESSDRGGGYYVYMYTMEISRGYPFSNLSSYDPDQYSAECWFQITAHGRGFDAHGSGYEENKWYKYPENPVVGTNWAGTIYVPEVNDPPNWNQLTSWSYYFVGQGKGWKASQPKVFLFPK